MKGWERQWTDLTSNAKYGDMLYSVASPKLYSIAHKSMYHMMLQWVGDIVPVQGGTTATVPQSLKEEAHLIQIYL